MLRVTPQCVVPVDVAKVNKHT